MTNPMRDHNFHAEDSSFGANERENRLRKGRNASTSATVTATSAHHDDAFEDFILSLKLRKPKHWKWELSTSKSSPHLALPRILLHDNEGHLLADVRHTTVSRVDQLQIYQEGIEQSHYREYPHHVHYKSSDQQQSPISALPPIDFHIKELADYMQALNTPSATNLYSATPNTTPTTTISSRKCCRRRHHSRRFSSLATASIQSLSILQRLSFRKGCSSLPDISHEYYAKKRSSTFTGDTDTQSHFFLHSCKAGTLVVKEDSFCRHPQRRRRAPRHTVCLQ